MFYLLNKKKGITSFKAIKEFARENGIKKVGHTGTLDPMATGLLLVATDDDTKLIEYIDKGSKSYIATMKLNLKSDTLDSDGNVESVDSTYDPEKVEEAVMSFVKEYDQMPPAFSAKKINGKRAYELAREGKEVILKTSRVKINSIKNYKMIDKDTYVFEVSVSRGTYIRSLIRDIAHFLGTEGIMTDLVRNELIGLNLSNSGQVIDPVDLVTFDLVEIKDLKTLFDGKPMKLNKPDGTYGVQHLKDIIGIIEVTNNEITKRRLFGKKYERILNESS